MGRAAVLEYEISDEFMEATPEWFDNFKHMFIRSINEELKEIGKQVLESSIDFDILNHPHDEVWGFTGPKLDGITKVRVFGEINE